MTLNSDRLTFVSSFTTRILGEVRPAFHGRGGSPVVSDLEDPKKDKSQRRLGRDWSLEGARNVISKRPLIDLGTELKDLETSQDEKRKRWLGTDQERYELTVLERKTPNTGSAQFSSHNASKSMEQHESYQNLCDAKRRADFCYLDRVKDEEHLRELRAAKNALQKIAKMRPNTTQPNTTQPERHPGSQATWTSRCVENRTEFMRIDHLLDGLCPTDSNTTASPRGIGVTSDDPGLCTKKSIPRKKPDKTLETHAHVGILRAIFGVREIYVQETMTKRVYATTAAQQRARAQETVMVESQLSSIRSNDHVWVEDDNNDDNTTQHQDAQAVDKATGRQQDANHTLHLDPNHASYTPPFPNKRPHEAFAGGSESSWEVLTPDNISDELQKMLPHQRMGEIGVKQGHLFSCVLEDVDVALSATLLIKKSSRSPRLHKAFGAQRLIALRESLLQSIIPTLDATLLGKRQKLMPKWVRWIGLVSENRRENLTKRKETLDRLQSDRKEAIIPYRIRDKDDLRTIPDWQSYDHFFDLTGFEKVAAAASASAQMIDEEIDRYQEMESG
ncbi:hypothetical protein F5H01DRAFT_379313 [Linnemannia elongata]|nr:hypothetical protein F5H01DRAFT_379313 [Linnemannia elongata]